MPNENGFLFRVQQYALKETFGAVFKEHWLVPVKVNPIGNGLGVEGNLDFLVGGENEEVVAPRDIVGSEGNGQSVINLVKDLGEEAVHNALFFLFGITKVIKKSETAKKICISSSKSFNPFSAVSSKFPAEKFVFLAEIFILAQYYDSRRRQLQYPPAIRGNPPTLPATDFRNPLIISTILKCGILMFFVVFSNL